MNDRTKDRMPHHLLTPRKLGEAGSDEVAGNPPRPRRLPGDPPVTLERMIRVDHAGEYGAVRIYQGQLAVMGRGQKGDMIRHMAEQEIVHKQAFEQLIRERGVRPTLLQPFWHVTGWTVGAASALLGDRAAMACTVAVETVIDEHYAAQATALGPEEGALKATIERFRAEELEHRDLGLAHEAEQAAGYPVLSALIKAGSKASIWLSERI